MVRMDIMTVFATNLRKLRISRNLSQEALAELASLSRVTIANYEGAAAFPREDTINAIAKALKVRPAKLFVDPQDRSGIPADLVDHIAAAAKACGLKVSRG